MAVVCRGAMDGKERLFQVAKNFARTRKAVLAHPCASLHSSFLLIAQERLFQVTKNSVRTKMAKLPHPAHAPYLRPCRQRAALTGRQELRKRQDGKASASSVAAR